jgi:hypothetical protein
MANHENSSRRDTRGNTDGHTPAGSGCSFTQVSSRLHGAAHDVSELLDLLTAGVAADKNTAARRVAGDDDTGEPGGPLQRGGDRGDSR